MENGDVASDADSDEAGDISKTKVEEMEEAQYHDHEMETPKAILTVTGHEWGCIIKA